MSIEILQSSLNHETVIAHICRLDTSCFDGKYITGDITESYLDALEAARNTPKALADRQQGDGTDLARSQLHLHLASQE